MSYVIYNNSTTKIARRPNGSRAIYATQAAAKAARTRFGWNALVWFIADSDLYYSHIEKTETVINIMTGKPVVQSVNTSWCCSPDSETYFSM